MSVLFFVIFQIPFANQYLFVPLYISNKMLRVKQRREITTKTKQQEKVKEARNSSKKKKDPERSWKKINWFGL